MWLVKSHLQTLMAGQSCFGMKLVANFKNLPIPKLSVYSVVNFHYNMNNCIAMPILIDFAMRIPKMKFY
jgi:hypothetical protein